MTPADLARNYKVRRKSPGVPITMDYFLERSIPEPNSGCWLWLGAVNKDGYGSIRIDGRSQGAHRVSIATAEHLDLSSDFIARHTCDNTFCVNPGHLIAGSIKDNVHDCMRRGRDKRPFQHGDKGPRAVLTEKDVLEIRSLSGMSHDSDSRRLWREPINNKHDHSTRYLGIHMTEPVAFKATYADWKLIKTRGVVQVVMEVPVEESDAAYEILGGMPVHGKERWFGVAAIKLPAEEAPATSRQEVPQNTRPDGTKRKMDWNEVQPAAQAGIRCAEPVFAAFLKETRPNLWRATPDAAELVRTICGVTSRSELGTNHKARVLWKMLDTQFQAWLAKERLMA